MPTTGVVFSVDLNCSTSNPISNSTTATYDAEGAMRFTVAVVLVFGIGVIGLLGIYHRRNINEDLSDKEADEFVKRFERKRYTLDKQYRKEVMWQLVQSFFSRTLRRQSSHSRKNVRFSLRPTLSEPNMLQCSSLPSEYRPAAHSCCPQARDRESPSQDQPEDLSLPDPRVEARSRSRSFHVPQARGPFGGGQNWKEVAAILNSRVTLLASGTESELGALAPDLTPGLASDWRGAAGDCVVSLPNGHNEVDIGVDSSGLDGPRPDPSVAKGGYQMVPVIMVNDVQVT